jgi:hypothetical protein
MYLALLLASAVASLPAAQLTAQLDRDTITLGEAAALSLTYEGSQSDQVPTPPTVPNLQIVYTGQSSQVSIVNGSVSQTVTHNFQVTARQPGEYTIPALTVNLGGKKLTTLPLKLRVLKAAAISQEAVESGSQAAFMRLVLPKKEIYLGEPTVAEVQIYFRQGTQVAGSPQISSFPAEGFNVGKIVPGQQQRRVQIGNAVYTTLSGYTVLTPNKTGPLVVGPVTATVALAMAPRTFEEQFFGGRQQQLRLATEEETIQCHPLPTQDVPPNFNGAVGSFEMTVTAGPTNLATGDPITVRVRIAGHGQLDAIKLPEQSTWHDFKTYPPSVLPIEISDQLGLQGAKTFEEVVTPLNTDVKELPAFSFSFFDPDAKQYRTLTQPPLALTVRPGGSAPAPVMAANRPSRDEAPPVQQDIVPIKERLGTLFKPTPPLIQQTWFAAAQGVPVLAFLAAFVWRKRTDNLANNPRLRRQRHVAKIINEGLAELRRCAGENQSDAFFAMLIHVLQEQIGERLELPAGSITEAIVDERLKPAGLPDAACARLHELFQACNLARYAPVQSSQELAAMVPRIELVIAQLKELKP